MSSKYQLLEYFQSTSSNPTIVMNACKNCKDDCIEYRTPINQCYNPAVLFKNDPQWATFDMKDVYYDTGDFDRTIYASTDGTCTKPTESFTIPLDTAVGPLGSPRSCGTFTIQ